MRNRFVFVLFLLCMISALQAQEYRWRVGVDYFFDNREYKGSSFDEPQTIQGIWLNTLGGIAWDSTNAIHAGVNLLKMPGTDKFINKAEVTLYYQYNKPKWQFRVGAFPRKEVLSNYSDFFFNDSINHFMPLMQGIFWQVGREKNFFNGWMDWTGYAAPDTRESFFLGFSGKASRGIVFGDFQSYLFHYAGTFPGNSSYGVSEQIQAVASLGLEYESSRSFRGLLSAGIFAGVERDRKADETYKPVGLMARAEAELYGIGTENRLYIGDARMRLYPRHGRNLYWGNPFLRGSTYLQSKWYIRLLESNRVSARLNCNLHFSEGHLFLQQTLCLTANIGNFSSPNKKKVDYPWMRIFR